MIGRAWVWANATDPRTWLVHALIAVGLAFALTPAISVCFYLLREIEQVINRLAKGQELHWVDHLMDVFVPAVAVGALVLL